MIIGIAIAYYPESGEYEVIYFHPLVADVSRIANDSADN